MILCFRDADVFVQSLRSGTVPPALAQAPVAGAVDAEGRVWVMPDAPLEAVVMKGLKRRGVTFPKPEEAPVLCECGSWFEVLPPVPIRAGDGVPGVVLFELRDGRGLVALSSEIRRLGNAAQGFRWPARGADVGHLLRVTNPPLHSLGRAREAGNDPSALRAFTERQPGLWVEVGFDHPLLDRVRVPRHKFLLISSEGRWREAPDGPFRPVDNREPIDLPPGPVRASDRAVSGPIPARLRLRKGTGPGDPVEMWVLKEAAFERLTEWVQTAPASVVDDLDFVVARAAGREVVLLRARPSPHGPPALVLDAVPCAPLLKLKNVYAPAGTRLQPTIRRDLLRSWLRADPGRVVWLSPQGDGGFAVESLPADAFRPLTEWVEYRLEEPARPHTVWDAKPPAELEFAPFTFPDLKPKRPSKGERVEDESAFEELPPLAPLPFPVVQGKKPPAELLGPLPDLEEAPGDGIEVLSLSEAEVLERLVAAEAKFLAIDGPLDHPERLALWPELAELSEAFGKDADAALCWLARMWEHESPPGPLLRRWLRGETGGKADLIGADLDAVLEHDHPTPRERRTVAALVAEAVARPEAPRVVLSRLPAIAAFLERNEPQLPVRAAWLAWRGLVRLSGGDVLGLTRARDRLLQSLLESGVNRERDVPVFLRATRGSEHGNARLDSARIHRLHEAARSWAGAGIGLLIDLTFAYGLARYGGADACAGLLDRIGSPDPPKGARRKKQASPEGMPANRFWLWRAYRERIRQHLTGDRPGTPLPPKLVRELDDLPEPERRQADRVRQFSHILEPHERTDPYRHQRAFRDDDLGRGLAVLPARTDAGQLDAEADALFKRHASPRSRFRLLSATVPLGFRAGEVFASKQLERLAPVQDGMPAFLDLPELIGWVQLLETALALAAHYDRGSLLRGLLARLDALLAPLSGERAAWLVASLSGHSFRFLSRLGLRDEARQLLDRMAGAVLDGKRLDRFLARPGVNRGVVLPALLRLAGGWFYFNQEAAGRAALEEVRRELYAGTMSPAPRGALACGYVAALGHAPLALALPAFEELFRRLPSRANVDPLEDLKVIEGVVLALAGEEFADDATLRRLLDEDEYLIRRRIHRDTREALSGAGM